MKINKVNLLIIALAFSVVTGIATIVSETDTAGRSDTKLIELATTSVVPTDTIQWVIRYIHSPKLLAHFSSNGDSTGVTLNVEATNFKEADDIWFQVANYTFSGAINDTTYVTSDAYWTYRFTLSVGDTTDLKGAVKITY